MVELGTEDPVPGPVRDRQGPARVLPAPAAESDPGRARRGRRAARRARASCSEQLEARAPARGASQSGRPGARAARAAAARGGRVRRHPHLPRVDPELPWDVSTEDNLDLDHARGVLDARPLRPREGQGADPRVPRRARS